MGGGGFSGLLRRPVRVLLGLWMNPFGRVRGQIGIEVADVPFDLVVRVGDGLGTLPLLRG